MKQGLLVARSTSNLSQLIRPGTSRLHTRALARTTPLTRGLPLLNLPCPLSSCSSADDRRRRPARRPTSSLAMPTMANPSTNTASSRLNLVTRHLQPTPSTSTRHSSTATMSKQASHPAVLIPGPIEYDDRVLQAMSHYRYALCASVHVVDSFTKSRPVSRTLACPS